MSVWHLVAIETTQVHDDVIIHHLDYDIFETYEMIKDTT